MGKREEDVSFYGVRDFNEIMRKGERKKMSTTVAFTVRVNLNNVRSRQSVPLSVYIVLKVCG